MTSNTRKKRKTASSSGRDRDQFIHILPRTPYVQLLHAKIRDKDTSQADFSVYSAQLARLVCEECMNYVSTAEKAVVTPTGSSYTGLQLSLPLCGVSIMRSGEVMEQPLRQCCPSVRFGKLLLQREGKEMNILYQRVPDSMAKSQVILLDPMVASGSTAIAATRQLISLGVEQHRLIFATLITTRDGLDAYNKEFPSVHIVTSEVDEGVNDESMIMPGLGMFGDRYYGTSS